jgi:hypothetical protein
MPAIKQIPPNRTVAVLTPLVFAPLAGAISVAAAKYVPGVTIDQGSLEAVFIAGATIALGPAGLWLKGWQAHEQREDEARSAVAGYPVGSLDGELDLDLDEGVDDLALDIDEGVHDLDLDLDEGVDDLDLDPDEGVDELDLDLDLAEDDEDELMALNAAPEA